MISRIWPFIAAALGVLAAVAAIFVAGRRFGRDAERVVRQAEQIERVEEVSDARDRMLGAASRRTGDRDALAERLRRGSI